MNAGLLPVKRLVRAKMRLARHFDARSRHEVARALLEDALVLCRRSAFLRWWVVTDDAAAAGAAAANGLDVLPDGGGGLNGALRGAIERLRALGATSVTIVPADTPRATPAEIADLVRLGGSCDVVVVPSARDEGTNALHLRPPGIVEPRFGRASLRAHLDSAARLGLRCSILRAPGLALDVDTIEDVDALLAHGSHGGRAEMVLEALRRSGAGRPG